MNCASLGIFVSWTSLLALSTFRTENITLWSVLSSEFLALISLSFTLWRRFRRHFHRKSAHWYRLRQARRWFRLFWDARLANIPTIELVVYNLDILTLLNLWLGRQPPVIVTASGFRKPFLLAPWNWLTCSMLTWFALLVFTLHGPAHIRQLLARIWGACPRLEWFVKSIFARSSSWWAHFGRLLRLLHASYLYVDAVATGANGWLVWQSVSVAKHTWWQGILLVFHLFLKILEDVCLVIILLGGATAAYSFEAHWWLSNLLRSKWTEDSERLTSIRVWLASTLPSISLLFHWLEHTCLGDKAKMHLKFPHVLKEGSSSSKGQQ